MAAAAAVPVSVLGVVCAEGASASRIPLEEPQEFPRPHGGGLPQTAVVLPVLAPEESRLDTVPLRGREEVQRPIGGRAASAWPARRPPATRTERGRHDKR